MHEHIKKLNAAFVWGISGFAAAIPEAAMILQDSSSVLGCRILFHLPALYFILWFIFGIIFSFILFLLKIINVRIRSFLVDSKSHLKIAFPAACSFSLARPLYLLLKKTLSVSGFFELPLSLLCILTIFCISFFIINIIFYSKNSEFRNPGKKVYPVILCLLLCLIVISFYRGENQNYFFMAESGSKKTNVLLVVIDALRRDHLSCYGYKKPVSPNIDKLAAQSALMLYTYSQSSWTLPATASLLTSLYPVAHKATLKIRSLPRSVLTMTEIFKEQSYTTLVYTGNPFITPQIGFDQGVDDFFTCLSKPGYTHSQLSFLVKSFYRSGIIFPSKIAGFLDNLLQLRAPGFKKMLGENLTKRFLLFLDKNPCAGFCAYIHYQDVHDPYEPPPPYDTMFSRDYRGAAPVLPTYLEGVVPFERAPELPAAQRQKLIALYDGAVAYVDSQVGEIVKKLEDKNLLDSTLIIITSDHGEAFYEHGAWRHGNDLHMECLAIPLLFHFPQKIKHGIKIENSVKQVDILPTILELCGIESPDCFQGRSLVPLMNENQLKISPDSIEDDYILGTLEKTHRNSYSESMQNLNYKLIKASESGSDTFLLYDITNDPQEQKNLADSNEKLVLFFKTKMNEYIDKFSRKEIIAEEAEPDGEIKSQLKALGYIQ